jgi:Ca-activated chloride channel family protein
MHPLILTSLDDTLRFGSPGWLWALLVILPLLWFFIDAARRREALLARIVAPRLQRQLTGQVSHLKRNLRVGFLLGAIVLIVVGLAKPRLGYKELEIKSKGRDVIIAIDTSRSMLSTDTAPTRLGRAKLIAQDLLGLLKGDRVGLIAFAGDAFLQAPLTLDKGAVLTSLEDLDTNTIPKGGTDIASAIRMAIAAFGKGEGMSRALILMTDGEDLEASGVETAK